MFLATGLVLEMMILVVFLLFALALPIIIAVFVYKDANKRVDCNAILWAIVAALVPLYIGLIVYLIIRRDYQLKPEFGGPEPGTSNNYYQQNYDNMAVNQQHKFPTWGKVLLIIAAVLVGLCVVGFAISLLTQYGSSENIIKTYSNF